MNPLFNLIEVFLSGFLKADITMTAPEEGRGRSKLKFKRRHEVVRSKCSARRYNHVYFTHSGFKFVFLTTFSLNLS